MLKSESEWQELPDWKNIDEYVFLDGASVEVWAWEMLRRRDDYRTDCDYYWSVVTKAKSMAGDKWRYSKLSMHYMPPKLDNETDTQWMRRVAMEDGPDPVKVTIHDYFPKKWGLVNMAPYDYPYGKYVKFLPYSYQYPCLIQDAESLLSLTEEQAPDSHEACVDAVKASIAVIAFDLTQPLGEQIKRAALLLKLRYKEMKKYKKLKRTTVPKPLTEHLVRHLRVLDARRKFSDITAADIARKLGYKEYEDSEKSAAQQGFRWLKQAEYARDNYLNFLIIGKSTTENI